MPLIQTDDPNATSLLHYLYTGVLWVDEALIIRWVNTQAEQLFATGKTRLIGMSVLDILLPINAYPSTGVEEAATKPTYSNAKGIDDLNLSDLPLLESSHQHNPHDANIDQLIIQLAYAKNYQQPFIEYDTQIKGVVNPLLVDYSVTPIDQKGNTYFIVELWSKSRQSQFDKEHQLQQQHEIAKDMLRSISHEVKNPLSGIRGAAQLLIKQIKKQENKKQDSQNEHVHNDNLVSVDAIKLNTYANIVISETDRLSKLISQLLGSNTLPEWTWINIHEPLEHVLMLTHTHHPKIKIERNYDLSIPNLNADKNKLIQVFLNLVNNACDAMLEQQAKVEEFALNTPQALATDLNKPIVAVETLNKDESQHSGYQPTLTISTRIEHQYTIGAKHHRQVVKIGVHDNGTGIDPQIIDRIFFPLVTGRASGTGLGLALVQDMIHQHHGAIEVRSELNNTVFWVYLPFDCAT